jgi:hypothetical protein
MKKASEVRKPKSLLFYFHMSGLVQPNEIQKIKMQKVFILSRAYINNNINSNELLPKSFFNLLSYK